MMISFRLKTSIYLTALIGLSLALSGCKTETDEGIDPIQADQGAPGPICDFDRSESLRTAVAMIADTPVEGFVCPVDDQDWYGFETGLNSRVGIQLKMLASISPVSPSYALVTSTGEAVATRQNRAGIAQGMHCLTPGPHALVVRDSTSAYQDLRNPYELTITLGTEPDTHEPNATQDQATPLAPETVKSGYIACDGDEDWYAIEVPDRFIMEIEFSMEITSIQPRIQLVDSTGQLLQQLQNLSATREATDLVDTVPIGVPGTYYLIVGDNSGQRADAEVPYQIQYRLTEDADVNEPNNTPDLATALGTMDCGDEWTSWTEFEGTFGVAGDVDWFKVPLTGCEPGLLEAEVLMDTTGLTPDVADNLQASVGMVRIHQPTPCDRSEACRSLNKACSDGWGCAGLGHQCIDGQCTGFGECMVEGFCGALQVQRTFDPANLPADADADGPPPNRAYLSAPIFGDDLLYLRVSDFGGDTAAPTQFYRLRVRTRRDPDVHEPSNVYMTDSTRSGQPTALHRAIAHRRNVVPVHLCGVRPTDPCLENQPACNNRADDDGDRAIDWPEDPGCTSWNDDSEGNPEITAACHNEEDDDGDGLIDYPDDPDCIAAAWRSEQDPVCPGGVEVRRIGAEQNLVEGTLSRNSVFAGSCGGQGGRETVYALSLSYPMTVDFRLDADFDGVVYGLWNCAEGADELGCGANNEAFSMVFESPGVFIIVVDSLDGNGAFRLHIDRHLPDNICDGEMKFGAGDMNAPDGGLPDCGIPDAAIATDRGVLQSMDSGLADAAAMDGALEDGRTRDSGSADALTPDARILDAALDANPDMSLLDAALDMAAMVLDAGVSADANGIDLDMGQTDGGDAGPNQGDAALPPPPGFINHCCGTEESDWIEGTISYEHDQDWYAYQHPCPGQDCMVRIVFELDEGPVDHLMQVYTDDRLWFDTIIPVEELPTHPASRGEFGGTEMGDQCFYAFSGHGESPNYLYTLSIRDLLPVRDWASGQKYRFCVEKVADGCHEPPCRRVETAEGEEECSVR